MKITRFIPGILFAFVSTAAISGVGQTQPIKLTSVAVLGPAFGGHKAAGNMEIFVENGIQLPNTISCDAHYLTTLKSTDPDRAMLSLLREAMNAGRPVRLWVTDDPVYNAYPGRCSLLSVEQLDVN